MTNWTNRFLELAAHVAQWSKDPSTQVGAVIVDQKRRVVAMGYNGFPRGVADTEERLNHRPTKYKHVVHAEANAILNATASLEGCAIYVTPLPPCWECAKLIIQSGITHVYFDVSDEALERWGQSLEALRMLEEAGVTCGAVPNHV